MVDAEVKEGRCTDVLGDMSEGWGRMLDGGSDKPVKEYEDLGKCVVGDLV